ncbi:hypothetical protein Agub_g11536 [Astrephomene gubernaculifera]|uniref:Uncharacterized protein n=1 Tax=Astrephomene gubernaculifera TaxID=47775 RepID=A0AAD3DWQ6_9CHLO|nr:hypothetical protein Agub_g11536 [Astrephomene gubernaculifera]
MWQSPAAFHSLPSKENTYVRTWKQQASTPAYSSSTKVVSDGSKKRTCPCGMCTVVVWLFEYLCGATLTLGLCVEGCAACMWSISSGPPAAAAAAAVVLAWHVDVACKAAARCQLTVAGFETNRCER